MRHTVWKEDVLLGTVDLPPGRFVASALRPAVGYGPVGEIVRRSTHAFLRLGLFYSAGRSADRSLLETTEWFDAVEEAGRLRLAIANADGQVVATHFINLLESVDGGIVVLVSLDDRAPATAGAVPSQTISPSSSIAPAAPRSSTT